MAIVKIDQDLILDELYALRKEIDVENKEALDKVLRIIELVIKMPVDSGRRLPNVRASR